jgi:hypothetical protein
VSPALPSDLPGRWLGVVAQLRRVGPEHVDRLVLVQSAAVPRVVPSAGPQPIPAWSVLVLGPDFLLHGAKARTVTVVEPCLRPVCRLGRREAKSVARLQAERDIAQALDEGRRWLETHSISDDDLEAAFRQAVADLLNDDEVERRMQRVVPMVDERGP